MTIVDQANVDRDSLTSGFPLTCFAKRAKEHLPDPMVGDVFIMRDSMVSSPSLSRHHIIDMRIWYRLRVTVGGNSAVAVHPISSGVGPFSTRMTVPYEVEGQR